MVKFILRCVGRERGTLLYMVVKEKVKVGVMAKADYTHKPSAYESENTPIAQNRDLYSCISSLQGANYASVNYKCCRFMVVPIRQWVRIRMSKNPLTIAKKRYHFSKKEGNAYCKKFIYTDVKAAKFKRQNQLYIESKQDKKICMQFMKQLTANFGQNL